MEKQKEVVHRVTLSSGKVVILRDPLIAHQDLAMKAAGNSAGDNKMLAAANVQRELVKILIHSIGKKGEEVHKVSHNDLGDLDKWFSLREFAEVNMAVDKISGGGDLGEFQVEIATV